MRKKGTELEERVWQASDSLTFRHGGFGEKRISYDEFVDRTRTELPEWLAILAMAHNETEWLVGPDYATSVSRNIWFSAITLDDYDLAETAMERCLAHPMPFDRGDSVENPIRLYAARFLRDRNSSAADDLCALIDSGIYRPQAIARTVFYMLISRMEPYCNYDQD